MFLVCCKNGFLNFLKRSVLQSFFPKTQGFAYKSEIILEFWLHAVRLSLAWCEDARSFKQALKRFLKLNQRSIQTKPNPPHRLVLGV
ncbi:hypothetical protein oki386_10710 [Helicobacter pylori]